VYFSYICIDNAFVCFITICTKLKEKEMMKLIRILWFLSIWSKTWDDSWVCDKNVL